MGGTCSICGEMRNLYEIIKRRSRVVNIPAKYNGGSGFTFRPGDRLPSLKFFVVFPQSFQANASIVPYNWTTTALFQILSPFTYDPIIQRYIVLVTEKAL
jgi:hypothetical protein